MANFEVLSDLTLVHRRDFPLASEGIADPYNANPLIDGEWLEFDSNGKLARGTGEGTNALVFPVHTERGRYDVQALKRANVLYLGMFEAESSVVSTTGASVGSALTVQDVTIGALTRKGLKLSAGGANRVVVGYVTRVVGSKLRFVHFGNQKVF